VRASGGDGKLELWLRFTLLTAVGTGLGEALQDGFALIAAQSLPAPSTPAQQSMMGVVLVVLGAVEGATLGTAQWFALLPSFERLRPLDWILRTSLLSGLAWFLISVLERAEPAGVARLELASAGTLGGLLLGLALGVAQARVLSRAAVSPVPWMSASVAGWSLGAGVAAITLRGAGAVAESAPGFAEHVARGVIAGGIAGGVGGLALVLFAVAPE
jgi:hypothetical protein